MNKLSIDKVDLQNKRVLVRGDFNVPLDENLNVTNDIRIVESLPTIKKIISSGGKAILLSHLGRPEGERKPEFSLKPAADRLSKLIGKEVKLAPDCIGAETEKPVSEMKPGHVVLLENLRFHKQEEKNDPEFARQLAELADVYIDDAFAVAHRKAASNSAITEAVKSCAAGFLPDSCARATTRGPRPRPAVERAPRRFPDPR